MVLFAGYIPPTELDDFDWFNTDFWRLTESPGPALDGLTLHLLLFKHLHQAVEFNS